MLSLMLCIYIQHINIYTYSHVMSSKLTCPISSIFFLNFITPFIFYFFPTVQHGDRVIFTYMNFSPTLCSVAIWVSRYSSQCYSAGSPCKSILCCIKYFNFSKNSLRPRKEVPQSYSASFLFIFLDLRSTIPHCAAVNF